MTKAVLTSAFSRTTHPGQGDAVELAGFVQLQPVDVDATAIYFIGGLCAER